MHVRDRAFYYGLSPFCDLGNLQIGQFLQLLDWVNAQEKRKLDALKEQAVMTRATAYQTIAFLNGKPIPIGNVFPSLFNGKISDEDADPQALKKFVLSKMGIDKKG